MDYGFRGTMGNTDDLARLLQWIRDRAGQDIKFGCLPELERGEFVVDFEFETLVVSEEVFEKLSWHWLCGIAGVRSEFVDCEVN